MDEHAHNKSLNIAMLPWFAMGHITPYLQLSNKLAERGHKISFFIPKNTQSKLQPLKHHPHFITFVPINIPHVDGLPHGAELTSQVPSSADPLLMTAMDLSEKDIEVLLYNLKPNIVYFDLAYWVPKLTKHLGIKSFQYLVVSPVSVAHDLSQTRLSKGSDITEQELMVPPPGFPDLSIKLHSHEAKFLATLGKFEFGLGVRYVDQMATGLTQSDAIGFKGCREMDGPHVDYLEEQYKRPVLLAGRVLPQTVTSNLDENWGKWLDGFEASSVVYCAFGSECILESNQFQELLLGLELSGMPFLAALKPPTGFESVEEAFPKGFKIKERVEGRGVVHGGWVPQVFILNHPSVGCFIAHCGSGSLSEALVNKCQLVLLPNHTAMVINARMMGNSLKIGVEVEKREEDGLFTKESVCKAVKTVMDDENEISKVVRANHARFREILLKKDLESSYTDVFCKKLQDIVG